MRRYDSNTSLYDNLDILRDAAEAPEVAEHTDFESDDLFDAKRELSKIDDELGTIIEELDAINDLHTDNDLTVKRMNEFFEEDLPDIIETLGKLKERLY